MRDHPAVTVYPPVRGLQCSLSFWNHNHKEGGQDESKSKFNMHEVKACVGLARTCCVAPVFATPHTIHLD